MSDHEADGTLVLTVIGSDSVRWACRVCNETVFERDGAWHHFNVISPAKGGAA